ncbi:MAG: hypothetical protein GX856_04410 [Gammaproteobacteria bacterium]|jgi:hypothetical protein|nr:hypothetical protein [Gammaproteobacteria bacterium]
MALFLDVGPDDAIRIGDTYIAIERKSGSRARLRIVGKDEVELIRRARQQAGMAEVLDRVPSARSGAGA